MTSLSLSPQLSPRMIARFAPIYERAASSHPALGSLPTLDAAAAFLAGTALPASAERSDVIRALATLAREAPEAVWSHLLLVAFGPFVANVVGEGHRPDDEAERYADVVTSFLEAVAEVSLEAPAIVTDIRLGTLRHLGARMNVETSWMKAAVLVPDMDIFPAAEPGEGAMAAKAVPGLTDAEGRISDERLLATRGKHGALAALVRVLHAGESEAARRVAYARLADRRARLVKQARRTGSAVE